MVLPEESVPDAPPQRKMSTRLRKKLFSRENVEGSEQVSLAVVSLSDRQGREMWNYVMEAILWNWMGKVLGWFRRGKAKNI
jgi:trehalose-6-phosphate synthase